MSKSSLALLILFAWVWSPSHAGEKLQSGDQYEVIGPLYLYGVYNDLNDRQLKKSGLSGSLIALRISGPEVAFERVVPIGTIVTITGSAPKRIPLPFFANVYFVRFEPEISRELDVVFFELNRGAEGTLNGLNPELFKRVEKKEPPLD